MSPELNNLIKYTTLGAMVALIALGITFLVSSPGIQGNLAFFSSLAVLLAIMIFRFG